MSLEKYLLDIEKKTDKKSRDEAYWKAREQSLAESKGFHSNIRLYVIFFVGFSAILLPSYQLYLQSYMVEVVTTVYRINTFQKQTKQGMRDVTMYTFRYTIRGKVYEGSKGVYGYAEYRRGQQVTLLVDPANPTKPLFKRSDKEIWMIFTFGTLLIFVASYFLFFKNRKKSETFRGKVSKQPVVKKRRGL